jgi:hypothetical protein
VGAGARAAGGRDSRGAPRQTARCSSRSRHSPLRCPPRWRPTPARGAWGAAPRARRRQGPIALALPGPGCCRRERAATASGGERPAPPPPPTSSCASSSRRSAASRATWRPCGVWPLPPWWRWSGTSTRQPPAASAGALRSKARREPLHPAGGGARVYWVRARAWPQGRGGGRWRRRSARCPARGPPTVQQHDPGPAAAVDVVLDPRPIDEFQVLFHSRREGSGAL